MKYDFKDSTYQPISNSLGDINTTFHKLYRKKKEEALRSINSGDIMLICRMDNRLIVKTGSQEQEFTINSTRYHNVKAMSHATLAVYYSLLHSTDKKTLTRASNWVSQIRQQEPIELGQELADITSDFLNSITDTGTLTHSIMNQYQQQLEPIHAKLMVAAANDEVDSLVTTLNSIRSQYNYPSSRTYMVVIGGHQSRYKALASMVFRRWFKGLHEHMVNQKHHVRYCEGGGSIDDAITLVATAITDRALAKSTMGSTEALNKDVLGI